MTTGLEDRQFVAKKEDDYCNRDPHDMTILKEKQLEGCTVMGYQNWSIISCQEVAGNFPVRWVFCENTGLTNAMRVPEMCLLQHFVFRKTQTAALVKPFQNRKF